MVLLGSHCSSMASISVRTYSIPMVQDCTFTCTDCEEVEWNAPKLSSPLNKCFICGKPGRPTAGHAATSHTSVVAYNEPTDIPDYDDEYPHVMEENIDTPHWSTI